MVIYVKQVDEDSRYACHSNRNPSTSSSSLAPSSSKLIMCFSWLPRLMWTDPMLEPTWKDLACMHQREWLRRRTWFVVRDWSVCVFFSAVCLIGGELIGVFVRESVRQLLGCTSGASSPGRVGAYRRQHVAEAIIRAAAPLRDLHCTCCCCCRGLVAIFLAHGA